MNKDWIRGCPAQTWWHTKLLLFLRLFLQVLWVTSGNHHCQVVLYHGFSAIYCTRLPAFTAGYCRLRSAPAAHTLGHASTSWTNPPLSPSHGTQCSLALGADGRQGYPATSKKINLKHTKKNAEQIWISFPGTHATSTAHISQWAALVHIAVVVAFLTWATMDFESKAAQPLGCFGIKNSIFWPEN